jgi:translation elongation factor EF-1alpha
MGNLSFLCFLLDSSIEWLCATMILAIFWRQAFDIYFCPDCLDFPLVQVLVLPCGEVATVKTIERDSRSCSIARAGDNVAICLQGVDGNRIIPGGILCHPGFPVPVANYLELKIRVLDITLPILLGHQVKIFHITNTLFDCLLCQCNHSNVIDLGGVSHTSCEGSCKNNKNLGIA